MATCMYMRFLLSSLSVFPVWKDRMVSVPYHAELDKSENIINLAVCQQKAMPPGRCRRDWFPGPSVTDSPSRGQFSVSYAQSSQTAQ